jgi:hypothetical protein
MLQQYVKECAQLQQNCTYTAEAHHHLAARYGRQAFWFQVVPAVVTAVAATLVGAKVDLPWVKPEWLPILTIVSSVVTAVANEIVRTAPPTDAKSFKYAQDVVQGGTHEPDKDEKGRVL